MEGTKAWFESWFDSEYYPRLYQNRNEAEAELLVNNLIKYLNIQANSRILDIACGEGRFAAHLAENQFEVTGIDLSEQRIIKAKMLEKSNLSFFVHDMRHPFYVNYFDFAFNFFTSFGYFDTPRDNHMAAHAFAACLKHGGYLVVDYFNIHYLRQTLIEEEQIERSGLTFFINKKIEGGKIVKDIRFKNESGVEKHFQERVSAFDLNDFTTLFTAENMELVAHFGNYELAPFVAETAPRLIMIFKKQ